MKRKLQMGAAMAALFVAVLSLCACDLWPATGPTVIVTQTQTVGSTPPSPAPAVGACEAAARLSVSAPDFVAVGESDRFDLTAFTASGQEIKDHCAASKVVTWDEFETSACEWSGSRTGFDPSFRGRAVGACKTKVHIDGQTADVSTRVQ